MQFKVLLERYFKSYWRSPPYNTTRLILAVVSGLIFGTFFWGKGDKYDTPQDINNVLGALFLTTMFSGFINFQVRPSSRACDAGMSPVSTLPSPDILHIILVRTYQRR